MSQIDLSTMSNNRERCIALINEGGATKQSLCEDLGINDKSLASLFAQLRLMGHYNIKNEDGTIRLGTLEEYEAAKPAPKPRKETVAKTPEQVLEAAQKRETKAATASTNAKAKYEANPCRENELRMIIADAELELASILLGKAESGMPACEAGDVCEAEVVDIL